MLSVKHLVFVNLKTINRWFRQVVMNRKESTSVRNGQQIEFLANSTNEML